MVGPDPCKSVHGDHKSVGVGGRVPAGRTGWDVCGTGSRAEALVASGGVVEVGSEVDIETWNADTRLIGSGPLCLVDRRL